MQNAKELEIDYDIYKEALAKLPRMPRKKIEESVLFIYNITKNILSISSENISLRQKLGSHESEYSSSSQSDDISSIAHGILDQLKETVQYCKASLQLVRGDNRLLIASRGYEPTVMNNWLLRPISHDKIVQRITNTLEPVILSNTADEPLWEKQPGTDDVNSWIGIPLLYDGIIIAIITIDHADAYHYKETDRESLISFARKVSPAIFKASTIYDAHKSFRDMQIINEIAQILSETLDIENVLHAIVVQITERLNCSHCTIFISENTESGTLIIPKVTHGGMGYTMSRSFKVGEGLAGLVFANGSSIVLPNGLEDPRFSPSRKPQKQPRSILVVPIKVSDQVIGIISADQDAYGWFGESERRLLEAIAKQAGAAIQRSKGFALLYEISKQILTMGNVGDILRTVISGSIQLVNATTGVIYLFSDDGMAVREKFHPLDFAHPLPRMDDPEGLTRQIIATKKVLPIENINSYPHIHPSLIDNFTSMIAVPLKIGGKVIGVFYLNYKEHHTFSETELTLLETLASQAAVVVQNAELLARLQNLLEILWDLDIDSVLDQIGKGIISILGGDISPTINTYNQELRCFGPCHAYGPLAEKLKAPPRQNGTGQWVLQKRTPLYIEDVKNPPRGCPTIRADSISLGIKSFAAVPLCKNEKVLGVLFVNSQKQIEFSHELRRVLEVFANQASAAIENASYYENAQVLGAIVKAPDIAFLVSGITHEFFNILQNMLIVVRKIKKNINSGILNIEECIPDLEKEISRAINIIDTFRTLRNRSNTTEIFDLDTMILELIALTKSRMANHSMKIMYNNSGVKNIRMNASLMQTILINLLRNAADAVENSQNEKLICIEVSYEKENRIVVSVEDSGSGIQVSDMNKLFVPFFTTKGSLNMGVGLFWIQKIVSILSGEIGVIRKNKFGGATFKVLLPFETVTE